MNRVSSGPVVHPERNYILPLRLQAAALVLLGGCLTPLGAPHEASQAASREALLLEEGPGGTGRFSRTRRAAVAEALIAELAEDDFEVVLDERPGLGAWRLVGRGSKEERFVGLVGLRGRVQEIEAELTVTAGGGTHLELEGRVWVYSGEPPAPGAAPTSSATAATWTDRDPLDLLRERVVLRLVRSEGAVTP